jgi:hypothetical protein
VSLGVLANADPKSSQAMRIKALARVHPGADVLIVIG